MIFHPHTYYIFIQLIQKKCVVEIFAEFEGYFIINIMFFGNQRWFRNENISGALLNGQVISSAI